MIIHLQLSIFNGVSYNVADGNVVGLSSEDIVSLQPVGMPSEDILSLHRVRRHDARDVTSTKKPTGELKKAPTKPTTVKSVELSKPTVATLVATPANATVLPPVGAAAATSDSNVSSNVTIMQPAPTANTTAYVTAVASNASATTTQATPMPAFPSEEELEKFVESGGNVTLPPGYQNKTDYHDYYNTTFYQDPAVVQSLWTDLDSLPAEHVITHDMLSVSHRRAATVNLTFDFPFYGHPVRNITIATGGFLFTGYMLHVWLAATQFIAPLMANFETISSNQSCIKYVDNGTSFMVEWHQVVLQDKPDGGNYTFQAVLHKSGDIVFIYKDLPMAVTEIPDRSHPVKVGISDAYMFDRMVFFVKRKTIYEYHQVSKKTDIIRSNTAIVFTALPTCLSLKTCVECRTAQLSFSCSWCDAVQRCSSGIDRHRQSWLENQCDLEGKKDALQCSAPQGPTSVPPPVQTTPVDVVSYKPKTAPVDSNEVHADAAAHSAAAMPSSEGGSSAHHVSSGTVVAVIMILVLVVAVGVWLLYAYRNPQTPAGQLLIKYRPSQWRLHGEARYTAATSVHI